MTTTFTIRFKGIMAGFKQTKKRYKASDHLRQHIARFSNSSPELVSIDPALNDFLMSRVVKGGSKVKVEVNKTGDILNAKLAPGQVTARQEVPKSAATKTSAPIVQKKEKEQAQTKSSASKSEANTGAKEKELTPKAEKPKREGKKQQAPQAEPKQGQ